MKKTVLLSGLACWALNAYSAAPLCFSAEKCTADEEVCLTVDYGMAETQYPWLNDFIWRATFPNAPAHSKMSARNLEILGQETLDADLSEIVNSGDFFPGRGDSTTIWQQQPEENSDYLQISSMFHGTPIGAAHGNGVIGFNVFKKSDHSQVDNILLPGATQKLSLLLQKSFIHYLITNEDDPQGLDRAREMAPNPIEPSERWHFAQNAIVFDYSPYEIAHFALGDIHLPVAVADLTGLVRADILRSAKSWPVPYNREIYRHMEYCGEGN